METWEGPHNVLFTQTARDIRRFGLEPTALVERLAGSPDDPGLAGRLRGVLEEKDPGEAAVAMAEVAPALIEGLGWRWEAER